MVKEKVRANKQMKRIEAIVLLAACKPLAERLAAQGVNIELTDADRAALAGFNQVWDYNEGYWLSDSDDVHRQAGLRRSDIGTLSFVAAMQSSEGE